MIKYNLKNIDKGENLESTVKDNSLNENVVGGMGIVADITKHKHIDEELRLARQRFLDIIDFLPDATFVIDRDRKVIAWNRAIEKLTGVHKQDLLGKGNYAYSVPFYGEPRPILIDLVYGDDPEVKSQYIYVEMEGNTLYAEAVAPFLLEGRETYLWSTASPLLDRHGNVVGAIESIRNITERHLAEAALKESEERYHAVVEQASESIFLFDADTKCLLEANAAFCNLLGYSAEHIPGLTLYDIVSHDCESVDINIKEVLANGQHFVGERRYCRKDGSLVEVEVSASLILHGRRRMICSVARDITKRKHAEERLRMAEAQYRTLVEQIPAVTYTTALDDSSTTLYISPQIEAILGFSSEDYMADPDIWRKCLHPDDRDRVLVELKQSLISNQPFKSEYRMIARDGRIVWFRDEAIAVQDRTGKSLFLQGVMTDFTERKKAEDGQKESRDYLNKMINSIGDPIFVKDRNHRFVLANDVLCNLMGHLREDIIGRTDHDFFPKDQADVFWEKDEIVFELGNENINDEKITDVHGMIREITTKKTLYEDNAGNQFIVGIFRDITDRKRAEDALQEARNYLENLFNYANAPIIVWDPAFRINRFNHAFEHLTGHKAEDVIGQRLEILFPESSRDASFSKIDRTLAGEYWESVEIPIHHKEGAVRIVLWNSANIYADDGKTLLATIAQGTDITERKVAEEAIKESERRLADIINFLPDATLVIDQDGKVIAWNHAIEVMTGIKAEEILGKGNYEYAIPFYGERIPILIDLVLKPQEEVEKRYTDLRRKDGTLVGGAYMPTLKGGGIFLVGSAAALYDSEGNISGAIESIRDVTENKHAEEELRKAKEDAESAMSAKAAFLANMSHELRTPMNAVIGFSSLLLDDTLDPEHRDYIEGIRNGGEALLAIINDILDFTRTERNRIELEHQPLSLKHLIDESLGIVAVQASEKGLILSQTINYGMPDTIVGDQGRLRQILVNLLSNAVKFTDKGNVSVSISSKVVKGNQSQIFFEVKDTGIGIPLDKMGEIFEPFAQVERTISLKRDGVGLGLAITKNLVELMGGTICAESILGQGTTFHVMITAETLPSTELDSGKVDRLVTSEILPGLKPMRILIAEDNPSNQRVLVEMLKRLGYRADAVADGKEVVQALKRQDYDLVLMDIKMPEMDGITATQVIRKLLPENGPKIIAITAFALEGDREKCFEAGMDDFISKPIQLKELAAILMKYSGEAA
jgi:PAS domain S-box-containing protein